MQGFSDAVIAIMVLELKAPDEASRHRLIAVAPPFQTGGESGGIDGEGTYMQSGSI